MSGLEVEADDDKQRPVDRIRQRIESLCLDGICGFVRRRPGHVEACLKDPGGRSCDALRPICDPRDTSGETGCGGKPTDYRDPGVLVIWAEGAGVQVAEGVRLLREEMRKWVPLRGGERLQAGDLLFLPPEGRIEIEGDGIVFGARAMEGFDRGDIAGHIIAVAGESTQGELAQPAEQGALSPAAVLAGSETMRFQSGAFDKALIQRSITYGARPESRRTLTVEEIRKINSNFDALHQGMEPE